LSTLSRQSSTVIRAIFYVSAKIIESYAASNSTELASVMTGVP